LPVSTAPYKRSYKHTKKRGRERTVNCDVCGREVPRYKTFVVYKGLRITDPTILQQTDRRFIHLLKRKMRVCPSCARCWGIVQPGKSKRRKHLK